jgi:hypothetical protein
MSYDEMDSSAMTRTAKFCAYTHARPDGSVFYVGKGLRRRAMCGVSFTTRSAKAFACGKRCSQILYRAQCK